jgi:hypothetical protein
LYPVLKPIVFIFSKLSRNVKIRELYVKFLGNYIILIPEWISARKNPAKRGLPGNNASEEGMFSWGFSEVTNRKFCRYPPEYCEARKNIQ